MLTNSETQHKPGLSKSCPQSAEIEKRRLQIYPDQRPKCQTSGICPQPEACYREIFDAVDDVILIFDTKDFSILDVNRAALEAFGYSYEESKLLHLNDIISGEPPYPREEIIKRLKQAKRKPIPDLEWLCRKKAGELFWLQLNLKPAFFLGQNALIVTGHEITKKKRIEHKSRDNDEKERKNEEMFKVFHNSSLIMTVCRLNDGQILDVNKAFTDITGYKKEEILGNTLLDLNLWVNPRKWQKLVEDVKNGDSPQMEAGIRTKQSHIHPTIVAANLFTADGEPHVLIIFNDIPKLTEQVLREGETKYKEVLEILPHAVYEMDKRGNITFSNTKGFEFFGYDQDDFARGVNCLQLLIPEDRQRCKVNIQSILNHQKSNGNEYTALRKDGSVFPVIIHSNAIIREGKATGLRGIIIDLTDSKQETKARREKEKELQMITENIPGPVSYLDADGCYRFVNNQYSKWFGLSPDQIIGKHYSQIFGQSTASQLNKYVEETLSGNHVQYEGGITCKSGDIRWVQARYVPDIEKNGDVKGFYALITDITDLKKAEQSARAREANLRSMFKAASNVGFVKTDVNGKDSKILEFSPGAEQIFGYRAEEVIGRPVGILHLQDDVDAFPEVLRVMKERKQGFQGESTLVRKSGETFPALFSTSPIFSDEGEMIGTIGISIDITERNRTKQALIEREERLRAIFEGAQKVSFIIADAQDPEYKIVEFSPGAENIFGYSRREMIGKPVSALHAPEHAARFSQMYEDLRAGNRGFSEEISLLRKSGEAFPAFFSTSPLVDKNSEIHAVLEVSIDLSEQKELEKRLYRSQRLEAIGTLAGGIAHDFNNILTPIIGFTEMSLNSVNSGSWDKKVQRNLNEVLFAANRAKELVNQILTFSRQREYEKKPITIEPIIKEVVKLLRSTLPSTIDIQQDMRTNNSPVLAEPTGIHQVIMNLCINAYHAMREKGGTLTLSAKELEVEEGGTEKHLEMLPGPYLRITVSDTGYGMSQEMIGRIFNPYFTTKPEGEGTGLGLSVAHGIIQDHGGGITVSSEPGKGTTFHVFLPIVASSKNLEREELPAFHSLPNGNERILLVDDERQILLMLEEMLGDLGYEVTARSSPADAYDAFLTQGKSFDLVITDQIMPGLTGADLAEKLLQVRPDIPIILCTGYSETISKQRAKDIGFREYLMKPVILEQLAETIRKVLDRNNEFIRSDAWGRS